MTRTEETESIDTNLCYQRTKLPKERKKDNRSERAMTSTQPIMRRAIYRMRHLREKQMRINNL